jgi:hypothetical protein
MMASDRTENLVTTLRRPPVHASTLVRSDQAHTFDTFVRTIGTWWPVDPFSAGRELVRDVTIEGLVGGRVYETWDDGTTTDWGQIIAWDPPTRFAMTWNGTPQPTEVELHFSALGPSLTRVEVEHCGWEALSVDQLAEDCALPGGYRGGGYDIGWDRVLGSFAARVARLSEPPKITDEDMLERLSQSKPYTLLMMKQGPRYDMDGHDKIIWEHGRRMMTLRVTGVLAIVCPIHDDTQWCGIGVFDAPDSEVRRIMDGDPGVRAHVLEYELHPVNSFPGDQLPS